MEANSLAAPASSTPAWTQGERQSLASVLDSFFESAIVEQDKPPQLERWGDKLGYSIFDEEEVLARPSSAPDQHTDVDEYPTGFTPQEAALPSNLTGAIMASSYEEAMLWISALERSGMDPLSVLPERLMRLTSLFPEEVQLLRELAGSDVLDRAVALAGSSNLGPIVTASAGTGSGTRGDVGNEPRAVRAVRRSCCEFALPQDAEDPCPICIEPMLSGQAVWHLQCFHQLHAACASQYFRRRGVRTQCPICRTDARRRFDLCCGKADPGLLPSPATLQQQLQQQQQQQMHLRFLP